MPYESSSTSVIVLFKAIYYSSDASKPAADCKRVSRSNGVVFIASDNKELEASILVLIVLSMIIAPNQMSFLVDMNKYNTESVAPILVRKVQDSIVIGIAIVKTI